jgi:branched-chain amino acid transport system substrate-binding protein
MTTLRILRNFAFTALTTGALMLGQAQASEQYFPLQSYRVGPYAAGGTGFFGGFIDYMNLINMRDGGVNGVKLTWDECETQYEVERGVECGRKAIPASRPGTRFPLVSPTP